jgi:hypothetical protein
MKANLTVRVMKAFASCTPSYFLKKRREMSILMGGAYSLHFPKAYRPCCIRTLPKYGLSSGTIFLSAAINFVLFGDSGSSDP